MSYLNYLGTIRGLPFRGWFPEIVHVPHCRESTLEIRWKVESNRFGLPVFWYPPSETGNIPTSKPHLLAPCNGLVTYLRFFLQCPENCGHWKLQMLCRFFEWLFFVTLFINLPRHKKSRIKFNLEKYFYDHSKIESTL